MPNPPIPAAMTDITAEWLTAALRSSGVITDAAVASVDHVRVGAGVGILGELSRATLTYDREAPGAPRTVIVKIPTADPGGRGIAHMLGYYEREIRYYRDIAGQNVVAAPRCYYSDMDPANILFVLLLEDLGALPIGDQVAGCSAEQARTVVMELARLHARWWNRCGNAELAFVPMSDDPMMKLAQGAYLMALPAFLQKYGERLTPAQLHVANNLGPRMNAMQDEFAVAPITLLHADVRLDNIFFGATRPGSAVTLLDWQILVKGRSPYDVAYFLSQSIEPSERKRIEEGLLRDYHASLVASGVSDYPWEKCWDDYRLSVLFCLCYPVISIGSIDPANERGVALTNAMAERSLAAITDLECAPLLERFQPAAV